MENVGQKLIELAEAESTEPFTLKKPLVWNSQRGEVALLEEYVPTCDIQRFYTKDKGYLLTDGCSTEWYTDDKVACGVFYDRFAVMREGHIVESFEDALRFVRKMANIGFSEIWDDEEEMEKIESVKKMALAIGEKIEKEQLL